MVFALVAPLQQVEIESTREIVGNRLRIRTWSKHDVAKVVLAPPIVFRKIISHPRINKVIDLRITREIPIDAAHDKELIEKRWCRST